MDPMRAIVGVKLQFLSTVISTPDDGGQVDPLSALRRHKKAAVLIE